MTVLLADIHGFLDNLKAPIELVEQRAKFYKFAITNILNAVGVSTEKLKFVLGSSYQKSPEYIMDVYKMSSLISERDAKKAGAEVVKQSDVRIPAKFGCLELGLTMVTERPHEWSAVPRTSGLRRAAPWCRCSIRRYALLLVSRRSSQTDLLQAWIKESYSLRPPNGCPRSDTKCARTC